MRFPFSVGDKIEVRAGVTRYSITTPGTILEITNIISSHYFETKVVSCINSRHSTGNKYIFGTKELSNFTVVNEISTDDVNYKYRRVIYKIRDMNKRRKESGYAY